MAHPCYARVLKPKADIQLDILNINLASILDHRTQLFDLMNNFQFYRRLMLIFIVIRLFDRIYYCQAVVLHIWC